MKAKNMIFNRFKILFPRREIFELMYVASVSVCGIVLLLLAVYIDGYEAFAIDYKPSNVIITIYNILFSIFKIIILIVKIYEEFIGYLFIYL